MVYTLHDMYIIYIYVSNYLNNSKSLAHVLKQERRRGLGVSLWRYAGVGESTLRGGGAANHGEHAVHVRGTAAELRDTAVVGSCGGG